MLPTFVKQRKQPFFPAASTCSVPRVRARPVMQVNDPLPCNSLFHEPVYILHLFPLIFMVDVPEEIHEKNARLFSRWAVSEGWAVSEACVARKGVSQEL